MQYTDMRFTKLILAFFLLSASLSAQQSIAMYSNNGMTGTVVREISVPQQAQGRAYSITVIMTAGISVLNVFPISVIVESSNDGVTWIKQDHTLAERDIDNGPITLLSVVSSARIESLRARYRVTISVGQSVVAVSVNLERL